MSTADASVEPVYMSEDTCLLRFGHRQQLLERRELVAKRVQRNPDDYLSRHELEEVERRLAALDAEVRALRK
jgi:hypothetical protein